MKANLYWKYSTLLRSSIAASDKTVTDSFESERYLGRNAKKEIRRTRQIRVLASPAFLSGNKS